MANTKNITLDQLQLAMTKVKEYTVATYSQLGHTHGTNDVVKLNEYVIADPTATTGEAMRLPLSANDTLNVALGKLDRSIYNIITNIGAIDVENHRHDAFYYTKEEVDKQHDDMNGDIAEDIGEALESAKIYTDTAITDLVNGAPATLDTLKELADALGSDPNFATTMANTLAAKVAGPNSSTVDHIAVFNSTDGKSIKDSGFTIQTSVPENALFTDYKVTSAPVTSGAIYLVGTSNSAGETGTLKFSTGIKIDPATNNLTATKFTGDLDGNAKTATTADNALKTQAAVTIKLDGKESTAFDGSAAKEIDVTPEKLDVHRTAYTEKATDAEVTSMLTELFGV